jgi:hypothetical protein
MVEKESQTQVGGRVMLVKTCTVRISFVLQGHDIWFGSSGPGGRMPNEINAGLGN